MKKKITKYIAIVFLAALVLLLFGITWLGCLESESTWKSRLSHSTALLAREDTFGKYDYDGNGFTSMNRDNYILYFKEISIQGKNIELGMLRRSDVRYYRRLYYSYDESLRYASLSPFCGNVWLNAKKSELHDKLIGLFQECDNSRELGDPGNSGDSGEIRGGDPGTHY